MRVADKTDIQAIMQSLALRCRNISLRQELLSCLDRQCWEHTVQCCTTHLAGYCKRPLSPDLMTQGLLHAQIAVAHLMQEHYELAAGHFKQAESFFAICDTAAAGLVKLLLGRTYAELGRSGEASRCYRESIELLAAVRDPHVEHGRAWRLALLARAQSAATPDPLTVLAEAQSEQLLAELYAEEGDLPRALAGLVAAVRLLETAGPTQALLDARLALAALYVQQEDWAQARAAYDAALRLALMLESSPEILAAVRGGLRQAIAGERAAFTGDHAAAGVPADGVPADGVPADGVPADGAPADGAPADGAPDANKVAPDAAIPMGAPVVGADLYVAPTLTAVETPAGGSPDAAPPDAADAVGPARPNNIIPFKVRVKPVIQERIAAGRPMAAWDVSGVVIQAEVFLVDGVEYAVRDIFTGTGDLRMDAFDFAVRVSGDSMRPTLFDGELVLARQELVAENGDICVVRLPAADAAQDDVLVKRFFRLADHVLLQPDNVDADWLILVGREEDRERLAADYAGKWPDRRVTVRLERDAQVVCRAVAVMAPVGSITN